MTNHESPSLSAVVSEVNLTTNNKDLWVDTGATRHICSVTPRSGGYGDVTATYIRRSEIPSRIYAKHQYRQESEYGSKWCIIHSNTWVQLQSYHQR